MPFDTLATAVRLMRPAATSTGRKATVHVIRRIYDTGRQVADTFMAAMTLRFDDLFARWNYVAVPRQSPPVVEAPVSALWLSTT